MKAKKGLDTDTSLYTFWHILLSWYDELVSEQLLCTHTAVLEQHNHSFGVIFVFTWWMSNIHSSISSVYCLKQLLRKNIWLFSFLKLLHQVAANCVCLPCGAEQLFHWKAKLTGRKCRYKSTLSHCRLIHCYYKNTNYSRFNNSVVTSYNRVIFQQWFETVLENTDKWGQKKCFVKLEDVNWVKLWQDNSKIVPVQTILQQGWITNRAHANYLTSNQGLDSLPE